MAGAGACAAKAVLEPLQAMARRGFDITLLSPTHWRVDRARRGGQGAQARNSPAGVATERVRVDAERVGMGEGRLGLPERGRQRPGSCATLPVWSRGLSGARWRVGSPATLGCWALAEAVSIWWRGHWSCRLSGPPDHRLQRSPIKAGGQMPVILAWMPESGAADLPGKGEQEQ